MTASGRQKRITYLARRVDLTQDQFSAHWSTTHADIARDFPGLVAYLQNHVLEREQVNGGFASFAVDGIVELWFEDADAAGVGFGSELADQLIEDEKRFLSGLTGSAVAPGPPTPPWPFKVWLLGASRLTTPVDAVGSARNELEPGAPVLEREALAEMFELPAVAQCWGFETGEDALAALVHVRTAAERDSVTGRTLLLTEERRIVER